MSPIAWPFAISGIITRPRIPSWRSRSASGAVGRLVVGVHVSMMPRSSTRQVTGKPSSR